jgi:D-inositol-3-phosphate glycosyltransferase
MNKKRIALIDPVGGKAGMDFYDSSLMKSLSDIGYETFLFSNFNKKLNGVHLINTFNNIGVNKFAAIFNNFIYFIKALFYCRSNGISWVILHFFRGGLFDVVTIGIARLLNLKIILIIHDVESLDTVALPITRKIILTKFNYSKIVHNQFSYNQLAAVINKKSMGNVHIIPHGNYLPLLPHEHQINSLPEFTPVKGQRYLLFFGQLKKSKGLDVLIKAMCMAPDTFYLIIAGKERDDSFSSYRKFISDKGLTPKIIPVIRFTTDEERDFLFRISEAVVMPYKKIYQSGVLLMAMSYSKPVIASDIEPNRELIHDKINGLLFRSADEASLAKIIRELFAGLYDENKLGMEAFKTIENAHSWQEIGRFYDRIFQT